MIQLFFAQRITGWATSVWATSEKANSKNKRMSVSDPGEKIEWGADSEPRKNERMPSSEWWTVHAAFPDGPYRFPWSGAAQLQAAGKSSCYCWCSSIECTQNTFWAILRKKIRTLYEELDSKEAICWTRNPSPPIHKFRHVQPCSMHNRKYGATQLEQITDFNS